MTHQRWIAVVPMVSQLILGLTFQCVVIVGDNCWFFRSGRFVNEVALETSWL